MDWYVGPWQWQSKPLPSWNPPPGFSGLDLRSLPDHAEGTAGRGIFFGTGPNPGSDYTFLGSGSWTDLRPNALQRSALPKRSGFTPAGTTLRAILASLLTDGTDPDGLDYAKPILPTSGGLSLELHAGSERVAMPFAWGQGHTNLIRTLLRREFAGVFAEAQAGRVGPNVVRKMLGGLCRKYKLDFADWREFVPVALQGEIEGPLNPETTISETFTGTLGTALGPNLTWTSVSGTWRIGSANAAGKTATASTVDLARADTDLSSADHYAQIKRLGTNTAHYQGACVRCPSTSTKTFYGVFNDSFIYIMKMVSGTQTNITNTANTPVSGDIYKVSANGSTIKSYCNGTEKLSTTDTAITGNLRAGIQLFAAADDLLDDFQAADLSTTYTQSLAGSVTGSGSLAKLVTKSLAGSSTSAGALRRLTAKPFAGTSTPAGTLSKLTAKPLAGSSTPTGGTAQAAAKSLAGSTAAVGATAQATAKTLTGSSDAAGATAATKQAQASVAGSVSPAGTAANQTQKPLAGSVAGAGSLSTSRTTLQTIAGLLTAAGALVKAVARRFVGILTGSGSVTRVGGPTATPDVRWARPDRSAAYARPDRDVRWAAPHRTPQWEPPE